ncbi:hypothetical protein [Thauera butanivorans]|uniref:hypothetical protein n=1 Tax=Thauera butanivorans TaxID=86174 RepID=UPI0008381D87|nr:hypothetical protein [Thauera butanivorans]
MTHDPVAAQLDALFAAPVHVTVGGRCVAVRGVWLGELAEFLRLYQSNPGDNADQVEPEDARVWMGSVTAMLARLCGERAEWIDTLPEADLDALFGAMWEANRILFDARGRSGPRSGEKISWATAAAVLVEAGHRPADIERYTLVQVEHYMAAHARLEADRKISALSIARAARASEKGYRSFARALESARTKLGR